MTSTESSRAGSTARVFRIPSSAGSRLILEQQGQHFDLSHALEHARPGDLLELIARGVFDHPGSLAEDMRPWPVSAPGELLTPFEPRLVGKILALSGPPRRLLEQEHASDCSRWFSNRSPASLAAGGSEIQLGETGDSGALGHAETGLLLHEVFLAAVIASRARGLCVAEAPAAVAGFMVASDFTRRSLDGRPRTPWFGESPLGTLVLGPAFVPRASFDLAEVTIRARRHRSDRVEPLLTRLSTDFQHDVDLAVAALSRLAILHPGDLVLIPTGVGLGAVDGGDDVHCSIDGIGELSTSVRRWTRMRQQA